MQNPFENPGFSMASLTAAINLLPNVYTRLGQMGLFRFEGVTQRSVVIEQAEGVLNFTAFCNLVGAVANHLAVVEHQRRNPHQRIDLGRIAAASAQACVKWQAGSGLTFTLASSHTSPRPAVARARSPSRASGPRWLLKRPKRPS